LSGFAKEVRQVVSKEGRMVNEFEVKAGAVPFLSDFTPFRYSGALPVTVDGAMASLLESFNDAVTKFYL
jgi:hypothetical protein